ncbi:MAG: dTMP kinase [bacterium]
MERFWTVAEGVRITAAAPQPPATPGGLGVRADDPLAVSGSSVAALRGVLRTGSFRRIWYATALSSLGDWLGLLATTALAASLATSYQGQNYALGLVLVVRLLPSIVLGPVAGAFADRFDRRHTMVVSDLLRFVLFLAIPISISLDITNAQKLTTLYVASFLVECVSLFWNPAKDASVPNLVRRNQVEAANQLGLVTTYGLTPVAAAALFSTLAVWIGTRQTWFHVSQVGLALYFDAATFLIAGAVVWTVREISGTHPVGPAAEAPSVWSMVREGAHFLRTSKLLRGIIVGIMGAFAAGGGVIGAGRTYVISLGGGNAAYGVLFGAVFVGLGLGMALAPQVAREMSRRRVFGLAIVLAGVCLVLTSVAPQVALAMVVVVGVGFGGGVAFLSGITLLGTEVGDDMRGRVFAFIQSLVRIVLILSLSAVPFIVGAVGQHKPQVFGGDITVDGTRIVLALGGLLAIAAGVFAYRLMDDRGEVSVWSDVSTALRRDPARRRRLATGGVLIAFEGGEGAGKSTQIALLAEALRAEGATVTVTFEPGATEAGRHIRQILLEGDETLDERAEALLFAADRAHHVARVIRPALDRGEIVLTDRFVDSSLAYQGAGRALSPEEIRRLSRWAIGPLVPDLTVVLDVPVEVGLARASGRGVADRLELETDGFHERVRRAFRSYAEAEPDRYAVLDATLSPDLLAAQIRTAVDLILAGRRVAPGAAVASSGGPVDEPVSRAGAER